VTGAGEGNLRVKQHFKRRHELENQFGQIVQGSQLLRLTGTTNVYYVFNREHLLPLDPGMWSRNTLAVLESRMQVLDNASKNRAVYPLQCFRPPQAGTTWRILF
jgi:hypothetical protein